MKMFNPSLQVALLMAILIGLAKFKGFPPHMIAMDTLRSHIVRCCSNLGALCNVIPQGYRSVLKLSMCSCPPAVSNTGKRLQSNLLPSAAVALQSNSSTVAPAACDGWSQRCWRLRHPGAGAVIGSDAFI